MSNAGIKPTSYSDYGILQSLSQWATGDIGMVVQAESVPHMWNNWPEMLAERLGMDCVSSG